VLHEWAQASCLTMTVDEPAVPVTPEVRGACEVLGLDPLHVANEAQWLWLWRKGHALRAVDVLRGVALSAGATRIGEIRPRGIAPVVVRRLLGPEIPLDEPWVLRSPGSAK